MFERLQKPFITVETGEAYQPIRISYDLIQREELIDKLNNLHCLEKTTNGNAWNWYWKAECDDLNFDSLDSFKKNPTYPIRLGMLTVRDDGLYLNLPSFKRACLAVPFFARLLDKKIAKVYRADFLNKVFGIDERLPHGFSELFKDDELDRIINQRMEEYDRIQELCEQAKTAEEAFNILNEYTKRETQKRLPYAERYDFEASKGQDKDFEYLGFYIFLRGRELVAIRRWFGETGYSLENVAEETIEKVFGGMDIDLID